MVSIELQDENFNTGQYAQEQGLLLWAQYLAGCQMAQRGYDKAEPAINIRSEAQKAAVQLV